MLADQLPDFPWDLLQPAAGIAAAHPAGLIDLSVGTPVDSVSTVIQTAVNLALDSHSYPLTAGSKDLVAAQQTWLSKIAHAKNVSTIPTVGSKEAVALLPFLLGLNQNSKVAIPTLAYPTYAVGAKAVGAKLVLADRPADLAEEVDLVWLNSPSNPTGKVLSDSELKAWINYAQDTKTIVASDECYLTLGWDATPISILDESLTAGNNSYLLALHSLSKRSSLAGYRAAALSGDANLISKILLARKHLGLIVPSPSQAAATVAWLDEAHAADQKAIYANRRQVMHAAFTAAGFEVSESAAGLYLWLTRGENCWESVNWLAQRGILVAPGEFYGAAGEKYIRAALTETDQKIAELADRLVQ